MMRRRSKRVLYISTGLFVGAALIAVGVHALHGYQVERNMRQLLRLARQAEQAGSLAQASDYLEHYLRYVPGDTDALARHGFALAARTDDIAPEERARALASFASVLARDPRRADVRREFVALAMRLGRFAEARPHLEVLLRSAPEDGELMRLLARCEEAAGRFAEAAGRYEGARKRLPTLLEEPARLAHLLRARLGRPQDADRVIDEMVAANGRSPRAFLLRGAYRRTYQLAGADEDFARAFALAPEEADVLLAAADSALAGDDLEKARGHLRRGIALFPRDDRAYRALADLELRAARADEAVLCLQQGLEAMPPEKGGPLLVALVGALVDAGRPDEAGTVLRRVPEQALRPPARGLLDARVLIGKKRWCQAAGVLERVGSLLPAHPSSPDQALTTRANLLLGLCFERIGDPERQLAAYRRAAEHDPRSRPARLGQAAALLALGRNDEALDLYRGLVPEAPELGVAMAQLLLLKAIGRQGERRWDEAERGLVEAARALPRSFEVPVLRATMLAAQGHLDEARSLLEATRDDHPRQAAPRIALADLLTRQGRPREAILVLDEAGQGLGDRVELRLASAACWARIGGTEASQALARLAAGREGLADDDRARLLDGLASAHAQIGDRREAERLWRELAAQQPDLLTVRVHLFDLALQAGDDAAIRRAVEEIRRIEGEEGILWRGGEIARMIARARRDDKDALDVARTRLAEVALARPQWTRLPRLRAEIAELDGDPDRAIEYLRQAIALGDDPIDVRRPLIQLLVLRGRNAEAERWVRELPEPAPTEGPLGRIAAEVALRNRDPRQALDRARRAIPAGSTDYRDPIWLGHILTAAGEAAEAEAEFRRAVELDDRAPLAWLTLVRHLASGGRQAEAEATILRAMGALPPDQAPLTLAQCYEAIARPDRAEAFLREALAARPDDAGTLERVAESYRRLGQSPKAEPLLRRIIAPGSTASPLAVARARRQLALGLAAEGGPTRGREALALIEENLKVHVDNPADRRILARLLAAQPDRRQEAIALLEDLARRESPPPDDRFLLARLHEAAGSWAKARKQMLELLALRDDNPIYLAHLADRLLYHKEHEAASRWVRRLEQLEPRTFRTAALRARLLQAEGRPGEAAALLDQSARSEDAPFHQIAGLLDQFGQGAAAEAMYRAALARSGHPDDLLALAEFLGRQGRISEALDLCDRAWSAAPVEAVGAVCLAVLGSDQADDRHVARVERQLDAASRRHPGADVLGLHLAIIRGYQGRFPEAEGLYRRHLARDGRNLLALNNLAWLLALDGGRQDEASALIARALAIAGPMPDLIDTRAVIALARGEGASALKDLEGAVEQRPSAYSYFHLAQAYHQAKNPAAAEAFRTAEKIGLRQRDLHPRERVTYQEMRVQWNPG